MNTLRISRLCLSILLLVLFTTACGTANPIVPATPTPQPQADVDMKSVLRDFLAHLPEDENLVAISEISNSSPFLVDVRQPDEYQQGFIQGSINLPLRELTQNLNALPGLDKDIVLVDSTGHRSAVGMSILQMLGFKKAKTLDGGLKAWRAANLPLVITSPLPARSTGQAPKVNGQLQAMLDYYLLHTLPFDWGSLDAAGLTADQKLFSSAEMDVQAETYDQGPSMLVNVDTPDEFARVNLIRIINAPLRQLPDAIENMPLQETIDWA